MSTRTDLIFPPKLTFCRWHLTTACNFICSCTLMVWFSMSFFLSVFFSWMTHFSPANQQQRGSSWLRYHLAHPPPRRTQGVRMRWRQAGVWSDGTTGGLSLKTNEESSPCCSINQKYITDCINARDSLAPEVLVIFSARCVAGHGGNKTPSSLFLLLPPGVSE